jgi:hypothetical protein
VRDHSAAGNLSLDYQGHHFKCRQQAGITVTWRSRRNDRYQLQFKSALNEANWGNVGSEVVAASPITSRFHALPPGTQRYYRVIALQ